MAHEDPEAGFNSNEQTSLLGHNNDNNNSNDHSDRSASSYGGSTLQSSQSDIEQWGGNATSSRPVLLGHQSSSFSSYDATQRRTREDDDAFRRVLRTTGENAFGIIAVDAWILDPSDGSFVHRGWWRKSYYTPKTQAAQTALARIEDSTRNDYAAPSPQIPGAGLAGYFWSKCTTNDKNCRWINLRAITSDPYQPPYLRMRLLEQAGFGKVTGVPFDVRGQHRGVVLYFARTTALDEQLQEPTNDMYLRVSADMAGSLSAVQIARQDVANTKTQHVEAKLRKVRTKMMAFGGFVAAIVRKNHNKKDADEVDDDSLFDFDDQMKRPNLWSRISHSFRQSIQFHTSIRGGLNSKSVQKWVQDRYETAHTQTKKQVKLFVRKCRGGELHPPPPMNTSQTLWTFGGSLVTLLVLSAVGTLMKHETGQTLILGPFGALVCLQFALMQAPVAQPRTAIYSQIVSFAMVQLVRMGQQASLVPMWLQVPLAGALAIGAMAKLGVTHPPAGAAAIILASFPSSSSSHGTTTTTIHGEWPVFLAFVLILLGNVITCLMAMLCNNWSEKRQFPIYWKWTAV